MAAPEIHVRGRSGSCKICLQGFKTEAEVAELLEQLCEKHRTVVGLQDSNGRIIGLSVALKAPDALDRSEEFTLVSARK